MPEIFRAAGADFAAFYLRHFKAIYRVCYGNTFAQFPVEDYAEVHVLDLRFFKGDVVEYAKKNSITDALVLYGTQNFAAGTALRAAV